ncbi:glycosyltransferase [Nocardia sp. NPDC050697]|uniref:glycosyltransferase n=1 Tax=Nocardia sp. NPDC050697 TaxID=3155158 RepID=UPI0033ED0177
MIGYYVHHHGAGHLHRARAIAAELTEPVTVLTSLPDPGPGFAGTVPLPRDDEGADPTGTDAGGALHWVPRGDRGLADRMAAIAAWIAAARPAALVVDVSVEVALLARLHGVPVVTMVLPGERVDDPHRLVHRIADRVIAAWPRELNDPPYLRGRDVRFVGGISRFAGRARDPDPLAPDVLVLAGAGGADFGAKDVAELAGRQANWRYLGPGAWVDDPWPLLCGAGVVITHCGQGAVADIAAAGARAVLIPAARPFGEQHATAAALDAAGLAVVAEHWPAPGEWPELLGRAAELDPDRWSAWRTTGAAARAAAVIEELTGHRERRAS